MANNAAGQAVTNTWTAYENEKLLSVGRLNAIGDKQAEYLRRANIEQMTKGLDRNGQKMAGYKASTKVQRRKLGLQTGKVDLKRTGSFHDGIRAEAKGAKINAAAGTATIELAVTVKRGHEGRLKGFRSGKYGKHGRNDPRSVIGMADVGTPLRRTQEKDLRRIALFDLQKALGSEVTFTTRDL